MNTQYATLDAALNDPLFPDVDVGLRSGRHYSLDGDVREYEFLQIAEEWLQGFYQRYGCRLMHGAEGYYYLLSDGGLLGRRQLSVAEMLTGQTLALMRMDPAYLSRNNRIPDDKLLEMLERIVGSERLFTLLAPRARGQDRETDARKIRDEIHKALNGLQRLGFLKRVTEGEARAIFPRPTIMRFADPVRQAADPRAALERLASHGEILLDGDDDPEEPQEET